MAFGDANFYQSQAAAASDRRKQGMMRLMQLAQARQSYTNEMNARKEREYRMAERAQNAAVKDEKSAWGGGKGWFADALIGGAMGFVGSGFNPLGAVGGALAGGLKGGMEASAASKYGKYMNNFAAPSISPNMGAQLATGVGQKLGYDPGVIADAEAQGRADQKSFLSDWYGGTAAQTQQTGEDYARSLQAAAQDDALASDMPNPMDPEPF